MDIHRWISILFILAASRGVPWVAWQGYRVLLARLGASWGNLWVDLRGTKKLNCDILSYMPFLNRVVTDLGSKNRFPKLKKHKIQLEKQQFLVFKLF